MLTPKTKKVYKAAMKNKEFLNDMLLADREKPKFFMDDIDKSLWATLYYGWLVGKYGIEWEKMLITGSEGGK